MSKSGNLHNPRFVSVSGLIYPDEFNIDKCISILEDNGLSGYVSPLHKPDNECKKNHYHVNCVQPPRHGLTFDTWRDIAQICGFANGYVEFNNYPRRAAQYLLHINHPEKEQFTESVRTFGSAPDYQEYIKEDDSKAKDKIDYFPEIIRHINKTQCYNYASLMVYSLNNKPEWVKCVKQNHSSILAFMRSCVYSLTRSYNDISIERELKNILEAQSNENILLSDKELGILSDLKNVGIL